MLNRGREPSETKQLTKNGWIDWLASEASDVTPPREIPSRVVKPATVAEDRVEKERSLTVLDRRELSMHYSDDTPGMSRGPIDAHERLSPRYR